MSINWSMLIIGGLFETGFAVSLGKRSGPAASLSLIPEAGAHAVRAVFLTKLELPGRTLPSRPLCFSLVTVIRIMDSPCTEAEHSLT